MCYISKGFFSIYFDLKHQVKGGAREFCQYYLFACLCLIIIIKYNERDEAYTKVSEFKNKF